MATEIRFLAAPSRHRVGNDTVEADRSEQQCKDCRDDDQLQAILFEAIPLDPAVFRWRVGVAGLRYGEKPSRLNACFGTLSPEAAMFYHQHQCPEGFMYHVQLIDSSAPNHIGDFNAVQPPPGSRMTMEEVADGHWSGSLRFNIEGHPGLVCAELVTGSALKILGKIYLPEPDAAGSDVSTESSA